MKKHTIPYGAVEKGPSHNGATSSGDLRIKGSATVHRPVRLERLRKKVRGLKRRIVALYYAYRHPDIGSFPKMMILLTLGYALSPVDLIPDFIPILGYLDDLILLPVLITLSIKVIPKDIMEDSVEKAAREPLTLKKNRLFGVPFIVIWLLLFWLIARSLTELIRTSHSVV